MTGFKMLSLVSRSGGVHAKIRSVAASKHAAGKRFPNQERALLQDKNGDPINKLKLDLDNGIGAVLLSTAKVGNIIIYYIIYYEDISSSKPAWQYP